MSLARIPTTLLATLGAVHAVTCPTFPSYAAAGTLQWQNISQEEIKFGRVKGNSDSIAIWSSTEKLHSSG
jgi:hypothetical protein